MNERRTLAKELDDIQQELKELEVLYEQYFAGLERREPQNRRNLSGSSPAPIYQPSYRLD